VKIKDQKFEPKA